MSQNPQELPLPLRAGTLTYLFTDMEASTRLWEQDATTMGEAMARHDVLVESCVAEHSGSLVRPRGEGDSRFAVFPRASGAVLAAAAIQRAFSAERWATPSPLRLRIALHTGEAELRDGDYYGTAVNRCARLRGVAQAGQVLVSQITRDLTRSLLPAEMSFRDLGIHRLKDLKNPEHIYQLVVVGLPSEFPPLETQPISPTNLPIQLTTFIGRKKEMARVKDMLATTRLLTLTGPGGSGKTRLAAQLGAEVMDRFPNGVWLVELGPLSDPLLLPEQVMPVLGLREPSDRRPIDILTSYLRNKELMLILDSCEHLIQAAAQLSLDLLSACPKLTILATSREAMEIPGETTFPVPALAVPDSICPDGGSERLEDIARNEAVQLFLDRATAVRRDFRLTGENISAVANICRRLDGIPLAIELAAARVNTLPAEQIALRLDDRFRLLTGGSRMALPRHQRLRTCLDWSYNLLSEPERILLRRLSLFPSSWSLQAAEQICTGDGIEREDILDLHGHLVNKSLVIAQVDTHETRGRMLETIRQYALGKLIESGETEGVRNRHAQYFLELSEKAELQLKTGEQLECLNVLKLEHDNLRAALEWTAESNDQETGFRLAAALWWSWCIQGQLTEGRELLGRLLDNSANPIAPQQATTRASVLYGAAYLAWRQGDYATAAALSTESRAICETLGDHLGLAWSLHIQALSAQFQGGYAQAIALFEQCTSEFKTAGSLWGYAMSLGSLGDILRSRGEFDRSVQVLGESLALFRQAGDRWGVAHTLCNLGVTESFRGNPKGAAVLLEESSALYRELGDISGLAYALDNLGVVAYSEGDQARAASFIEEGLTLRRELGNQRGVAASLGHFGKVALMQGKWERAMNCYTDGLTIARALGDRLSIAVSFGYLGELALEQGQLDRAAQLFGAADALRQAIGAPLPKADRAHVERELELLQHQMGEAEFARAWNVGRKMKMERSMDFALNGIEEADLPTAM